MRKYAFYGVFRCKKKYNININKMYKRLHCLNCGRKFTRVYDRRRHEKSVSCEKREIYNDVEILVRMSSLESSVLKLEKVCEKLCVSVLELSSELEGMKKKSKRKRKKSKSGESESESKNVKNEKMKQKKMSEYV